MWFMCAQVPVSDRTAHINTLMRQLVDWALSPSASASKAAAAAAATAARLGQQLQLHDHTSAATTVGLLDAGSSSSCCCRGRQQQLLQLPLDSSEEAVLVAVLRERMAAGKTGGHLLPLYLLQVRSAGGLFWHQQQMPAADLQCLQEALLARRLSSPLVTAVDIVNGSRPGVAWQ